MQRHEKAITATFSFLDYTLSLKEYVAQITTAADFSELSDQYPLLTNTTLNNRTKRAIQEKWLKNKLEPNNNAYLSWTYGIVTITFSVTLLIQLSNFLARRLRFNEQSLLVTLGTAATLIPSAQAAKSSTTPVLSLVTQHKFSIASQCVKSESCIGWLGICVNQSRIIYWQQVAKQPKMVHFESYLVNRIENADCYLTYENRGLWVMSLNQIDVVPLKAIYFQLPPSFQAGLEWQNIFFIWQQQMMITAGRYMGNVLTLHTPLGNLFKTVGLAPDWQGRDDIHFLSRCWITMQQLLFQHTFAEKLFIFSLGLSEVILLHRRTQFFYTYLTRSDLSKAKPVIRLIVDLLQLGFYNFIHLARLLELSFPNNESIWKLSLGLQMVNSFYNLTEDLSYWYLGMALFVLPYLPILLENLGIPVTKCLHNISNKLAQLFIGQSLLTQLSEVEDEERVAQQRYELLLADARVKGGRYRLKHFISEKFSFFASNDNYYNQPKKSKEKIDVINTKRSCQIQ